LDSDGKEDGRFVHVWDDRTSLFSTATLFNVYSVGLDGVDSSMNGGDIFQYDVANAWSLVMWVKPDNTSAQRVIYSKATADANVFGVALYHNNTGKIFLQMRASGQLRSYTGSLTLTSGVWQQIALTYNGGNNINGVRVYVNDTVDTTPSSGTLTNTLLYGQDALFGRRGSSFYFSGNMDHVGVYNRVLTLGEITEHYNSDSPLDLGGINSTSSNLVSYYTCGDGDSGLTVLDNTSTNDLTLEGGAVFEEDVP
jgi:hypothetical protein